MMAVSSDGLIWFMKVHLPTATNEEIERAIIQLRLSFVCFDIPSDNIRDEIIICWCYLQTRLCTKEMLKSYRYANLAIKEICAKEIISEEEVTILQRFLITLGVETNILYRLALGTMIVHESNVYIKQKYTIDQLVFDDTDENRQIIQRFKKILNVYSEKCTYERTGDIYIHMLLRSKLSAWRNALLNDEITPYDMITDQYGGIANTIVRPFIEQSPATKMAGVSWKDTANIDSFHFVLGLVRELLDGYQGTILVNTAISRDVQSKLPELFVCSSDFDLGFGHTYGFRYENKLHLAPVYEPLIGTLLFYIERRVLMGDVALESFLTAIKTPGLLPASSPFNSFV